MEWIRTLIVALLSVAAASWFRSHRHLFGLSASFPSKPSLTSETPKEEKDTSVVIETILQELDEELEGRVIYPHDDNFPAASKVWATKSIEPRAVIQVQSEKDVAKAIPILSKLDSQLGVPFRIKSGGHHYDASSSVQNGIVLELTNLNSITLDDESQPQHYVTIGPAVKGMDILEHLVQPLGMGAVIGACPSVGLSGLILGGGFSYWSRHHGLAADNVLEMRVVLASGDIVTANASNEYADLFWALLGAGSAGFGVVTQIKYKVFTTQDEQLYGMGMVPNVDQAARFLTSIGERNLPGNAMIMLFLFPNQYFGDDYVCTYSWYDENSIKLKSGRQLLNQTFQQVLPSETASKFSFETKSWTEHSKSADMPGGKLWRAWNGFVMPENNTVEKWTEILNLVQNIRNVAEYVTVEIGLWGGKMSEIGQQDTAFAWRNGLFNVCINLGVPETVDNAEAIFNERSAMIDQLWPEVKKHLEGVYYNYPMSTLGENEYAQEYFGANLPRLVQIKKKYDPNNVFRHPQSIPLKSDTATV